MSKVKGAKLLRNATRLGIPEAVADVKSLQTTVNALKTAVEQITRSRGDIGNSAVVVNDLMTLGFLAPEDVNLLDQGGSKYTQIGPAGLSPGLGHGELGGGGGGGAGVWGSITGTLSDQTDLQAALDTTVKLTGNQTIAGTKSFTGRVQLIDQPLLHSHGALSADDFHTVMFPKGASYHNDNPTITGFIRIRLPRYRSVTMMQLRISGYDYHTSTGAWEVIAGGYSYASGWTNTSARIVGKAPFGVVRFVDDTVNSFSYILLGVVGNVWNYPKVQVVEANFGYQNQNPTLWESGWVVDFINSDAGMTVYRTEDVNTFGPAQGFDNGLYIAGSPNSSLVASATAHGSLALYGSKGGYHGITLGDRFTIMAAAAAINAGLYNHINGQWVLWAELGQGAHIGYAGTATALGSQNGSASGASTWGYVRHSDGVNYDAGMNVMPPVLLNTSANTLIRTRVGMGLRHEEATNRTWTTPASTDTTVPEGAVWTITNFSTGTVTIAAGSGVTIYRFNGTGAPATGSRILSQGGVATLWRVAPTVYYLWGNAGLN